MKSYLISYAVNDTPVHQEFLAALKAHPAELLIVRGYYKNPTSRFESYEEQGMGWAPEVLPYLVDTKMELCEGLTLFGNIRTQPTAGRPLTGLEVYVGRSSAIVGHPKRALQTVPTASRTPRILATTGACTLANYSHSNAGAKGEAHHVLGALVVEVDEDEVYFVRQVTWDEKSASFTDLDRTYSAHGYELAERPLSVTLGDVHVGQEDWASVRAAKALVSLLRPEHLVLHDVLDFDARSHHRQSPEERWDRRFSTVEAEMDANAHFFNRVVTWGADQVDVIESNHHEHLLRWLREFRESEDILNAPFYHQLKADMLKHNRECGTWPNVYELEMRSRGIEPGIRFLTRDDSLRLARVEHAFHGDKGINGARGSAAGYAKLGVKVTIGHSHTPCIIDGVYQTGVTGRLDMGYNTRPSTWLQAHVVLHADGRRQLVIITGGRFRGGQQSSGGKKILRQDDGRPRSQRSKTKSSTKPVRSSATRSESKSAGGLLKRQKPTQVRNRSRATRHTAYLSRQ